jgi:hypothetical protein
MTESAREIKVDGVPAIFITGSSVGGSTGWIFSVSKLVRNFVKDLTKKGRDVQNKIC